MISGFGSGFRGEFGLVGSRFGGWFGGRESVVNIYLKIASTRRVAGTRLKVMGCVIVCVCKGKDVFDEDRKIEKTLFKNLMSVSFLFVHIYRYNRGNCEYAIFSGSGGNHCYRRSVPVFRV